MNPDAPALRIDQLPRAILFDFGDTLMEILDRSRRRGIEALLQHATNLDSGDTDPARSAASHREALIGQLAEFGRSLDYRFETLCARHNLEYQLKHLEDMD